MSKLGQFPELIDIDMREILRVLANYVEFGMKNSNLEQEKIDSALLGDGFINTHTLRSLLNKHLNLMKRHSSEIKELISTITKILIDIQVITEITVSKPKIQRNKVVHTNSISGYKTLPIKQLREMSEL